MAINSHELVGNALAHLRDGLKPFIERECAEHLGEQWRSEIHHILDNTRFGKGNVDVTQDVAAQLTIMDRLWGDVFRKGLGRAERSFVNELIDVRNRWAHQRPFSDEDVDRALDSTIRLLSAISAPQVDEVRRLRAELRTFLTAGLKVLEESFPRSIRSAHRERILNFLTQYPGRDDDEIAAALEIRPRQTVNQICRKLCDEHALRRERGKRGKILNFVIANSDVAATSTARSIPETVPRVMTEDQVKSALETMLKSSGWSVKIAWGRERGVDIEAQRTDERWLIECKGEGSIAPMQNNYFVSVIGELMQRMSDTQSKHSIAFPDRPKFRRLWQELPATVKERLQLSALFVSNDGTVIELST